MILVSRHLTDYIDLPDYFVIRINLAWEHDIAELLNHISLLHNPIFLDIPIGRKKPPNNEWNTNDIIQACVQEPLIQYLAVSNVESSEHYQEVKNSLESCAIQSRVCIVPKIESIKATQNIENILLGLNTELQRTIMIDHDDLFSDLIRNNIDPSTLYNQYVLPVVRRCKKYDVRVLRTAGVVFCDI
jgi:hypothetical protein